MSRESGNILAGIISSLIVAVMLIAPAAVADAASMQPVSNAYTISGYVFVNGEPTNDVLVYTSYGGGSNAVTGADSAGRRGYYALVMPMSDGPATVIAIYAKAQNVSAWNYSATATIEHPDTADGYDTQNLYIDTSQVPVSPALMPSHGPLDNIAHVVNNFIGRLADWAASIGVDNASSGTVVARAATFNAAEVPHAYLALVNASNQSDELYRAQADDHGVYRFQGVKSSYNTTSGAYDRAYCLKAKAYGNTSEGLSTPFSVMQGQAANVTAVIFPKPSNITMQGPKRVDVNSHAMYMAYVTDALGHPVADGNMIRFTLSGNDTAPGQFGAKWAETPAGRSIVAPTRGGYAEVEYGWATRTGNDTINAAYRDDMKVNGSITIALD
jgi:hypothetical protein